MVVVNVLFLFLIGFNIIRIYEEPSGGGRENVSMILQAIVVFFHDKMALLAVVSHLLIYYVEVEQIDFSGSCALLHLNNLVISINDFLLNISVQ